MSVSKETEKRVQTTGMNKREAEKLEEKAKAKKTTKLAITVVAVVVVLVLLASFINSKFIRRHGTAYTVDGMDFTAAEFDFQFCNYYYDYVQYVYTNNPDYASMLLPSTVYNPNQLAAEEYYDGITWKEHFQQYTEDNLARDVALYNEAKENGFTQTDEQLEAVEEQIRTMEGYAATAGYASAEKYLRDYYGVACNMDILREQITWISYARDYETYRESLFTYTDEEIQAAYNENRHLFDLFDFRYFIVYADEIDESQYEGDEEGLEAAKQFVLDIAHDKAVNYMNSIGSEEDFIRVAAEEDPEKYSEEDSTFRSYNGDLLGSTYGEWLRGQEHTAGDMTVADATIGSYVVMYLDRQDNGYNTKNVRSIFLQDEAVNQEDYENEEDDTAYNEAVQAAKDACWADAEDLLADFNENGGTEEYFADLAKDNSRDTTTGEGGLVSNVYHGQFSENINDWIFDEARQSGDIEMFRSSNDNGVYIFYFIGDDMPYNLYLAKDNLYTKDHNTWSNSLGENAVSKRTWLFALT